MHGLDLYDFHARQQMPDLGIFTSMDPLAEKYYSISPYAYCANNPIKYIDPDGRGLLDFLGGIAHSVGENLSVELYQPDNDIVEDADDYNTGRDVGDVVSVVMGIAEVIKGGGTAIGGAAGTVVSGGTGAPITVPVAAVGVAVAVHGAAVVATAIKNLVKQEGRVLQASQNSNNTKSIGPAGDAGGKVTKQLPKNMQNNSSSTKNGTIFHDPSNPKANSVRVQSGNPNSSNPGQQKPYVKEVKNGKVIDNQGNEVNNKIQESHIPVDEYKYKR